MHAVENVCLVFIHHNGIYSKTSKIMKGCRTMNDIEEKIKTEEMQDNEYKMYIANSSISNFKKDLQALLRRYDACVGASQEDDAKDINDQKFVVNFGCPKRNIDKFKLYTEYIVLNKYSSFLDHEDVLLAGE